MITKTNEVRIFTFTGHPEDLSSYMLKRMDSHDNRVIDILSATESMTTRDRKDSTDSDPVLHYTMLYRLT